MENKRYDWPPFSDLHMIHLHAKNWQKSTPTEEAGGASSVGDTQTPSPSRGSQGFQFREFSKFERVERGIEPGTVGGTTIDLNSAF